jgi:two-component system, cell cycle response regulator DivK
MRCSKPPTVRPGGQCGPLILIDIQLRGIDGYEAARDIKADPNMMTTRIIAVSSFAMKCDEEKARASELRQLRDEAIQPDAGAAAL